MPSENPGENTALLKKKRHTIQSQIEKHLSDNTFPFGGGSAPECSATLTTMFTSVTAGPPQWPSG